MNKIQIRLQTLQLIGLLLPIIVLILRAFLNTFEDRDTNAIDHLVDKRNQRYGSIAAILSILTLILSGLIVLTSLLFPMLDWDILLLRIWALCLFISFISAGVLVLMWLSRVIGSEKVELI